MKKIIIGVILMLVFVGCPAWAVTPADAGREC